MVFLMIKSAVLGTVIIVVFISLLILSELGDILISFLQESKPKKQKNKKICFFIKKVILQYS
jgi:hypothetical protein